MKQYLAVSVEGFECMDRYLIYATETDIIKRAVKLIYAFRVALSIILVIFQIKHAGKMVVK